MREVKKYSPEKNCRLEYDKLRVDGKTFIFREVLFRKLNTDTAIHLKLKAVLYHHHYMPTSTFYYLSIRVCN